MAKCSLLSFKIVLIIVISLINISICKKLKETSKQLKACSSSKPVWTSISLNTDTNTGDCTTSQTNDFKTRQELQNYYTNCNIADTWGPWPKLYSPATIPKDCDKEAWMRGRVLKAIDYIVSKKYNYCHHHSPHWLPPKDKNTDGTYKYRNVLDADHIAEGNDDGVCSGAYFPSTKGDDAANYDAGWNGIDCSHFSCYTYNFSFGAFLNTNVSTQACDNSKEARAVSSFLPFTKDDQDKFKAGDLLYIAKNSSSNPLSISHVIIWTGYKLGDPGFSQDEILLNIDPAKKDDYVTAIKKNLDAKKPVYIIADSHFIGPNYRPFVSWYYKAFSHARRIIGKAEFDSQEPKQGTELTTSGCNVPK